MKDRIYVCHTFYHVYITCIKELLRKQDNTLSTKAAIVLSRISTDFGDLKIRLENSQLFSEVLIYDEKSEDFFPGLKKYRASGNNIIKNMINRIIFTKKLGKAQIPFLPTDFRAYRDIYVFCDSDPIGYYLNYARIPYHAIEDGLNCLVLFDAAHYDNRGYFRFKAWMSARNFIFIQNGYGKYCLDMEVNDISILKKTAPNYIEQSRENMTARLSDTSKEVLVEIFIANIESLKQKINEGDNAKRKVLILTEKLCSAEAREKLFKRIINKYGKINNEEALIIIKPHPMDNLDYQNLFPEHIVLDGKFPMEILNLFPGLFFDLVVSIFTVPSGIKFAGEIVNLGQNFVNDENDKSLLIDRLSRYAEEILKG